MTTQKYAEVVAEERAARAARVKHFLAEQEETDVIDLFDAMRDIIDDRESDEHFFIEKFFHQVREVFDGVEDRLCNN